MAKEKHIPNFESPMLGVTWLIPEQCRNCFFRDREGAGWRKDSCRMFEYPDSKPQGVLENEEECIYYEPEKRKK